MTATDTAVKPAAALLARFAAFIAERHPFALKPALAAIEEWSSGGSRETFRRALETHLAAALSPDTAITDVPDTTPGISVNERLHQAVAEVIETCDGFLRREEIAASFTADEKRDMLRGMILTRAVDNRLKQFFTGGEVRYGNASFQGKGFRSLGQEAIYAAALRLRDDDVISPMIRDLGAVLCKSKGPDMVRAVLNAQMGKAG